MLVVEDYVTPDRLRAVLAAHGLDRELLAVEPGAPLPTLGEMIDARTRLLVSLENGDGGPTMPNAFTGLVEETPFTFLRPSALRAASSCDANRGVDGSPVFQFNHWVTPPVRPARVSVNRRVLRDRGRALHRAARPDPDARRGRLRRSRATSSPSRGSSTAHHAELLDAWPHPGHVTRSLPRARGCASRARSPPAKRAMCAAICPRSCTHPYPP